MRTRRHLEFLASAFGLLLATARGALATNVGGTITADTTWNLAGSPYVVTSTVYVEKLNAGSVTPILTIDPGVTVSFNGGTSLIIGYNFAGELHAGAVSPAAAATFTANGSTTAGFWAGIKFWTNATSASYIKNASIKYGGVTNATGGIHVNGSSPTLQALTVQNNAGSGISISGGSPSISSSTISSNPVGIVTWAPATPSLQTLTLSSNTGFAISQDCNQTLGTVSALTMTGNGTNAVELRGGTVAANTTWKKAGSPYVITNQVYVEGTPTPVLTIEAGTTVKVAPNTALYVGYNTPGDLQAIGTSSLPIVFTASSGTTAGSWRAVSFNSHTVSTAKMVYVTVSYGGYPAYSMGGIQIVGCSPTLQNVTVSNNLYAGISISGGSPSITGSTATGNPWGIAVLSGSPSISTTTVSSNTTGGISLGAPGTPSLQTLTITNNTGFAISQDCSQTLGTVSALTMTGNGTNAVELRGGTVAANTTWKKAGSPYVITNQVYVEGTPTPVLTIEAGTTVKVAPNTALYIGYNTPGDLQAIGTSSLPIVFTASSGTTAGSWRAVSFNSHTVSTAKMVYVTVSYGGYAAYSMGGIQIVACSPTLQNVTVSNNAYAGITVAGAASPSISASTISGNPVGILTWTPATPSFQTLTLSGNAGFAISQDCNQTLGTVSALTSTGNGTNAIELRGGTVAANTTWKKGGSPYVMTNQVYVEGTPTPVLTIEAGTTVKVVPSTSLYIGYNIPGDLQAIGTASQPIVFTANTTTPTPGYWRAVSFNSHTASTAKLVYATVSYGGYGAYSMGGVQVVGCSPILQNLTLSNNTYAGISVSGGSPAIINSSFAGNTAGLINLTAGTPITANLNYWGSATGPSGAGPGTGQSVSTGVKYEPWLLAAPSSPNYFSSATQTNRTFNPAIAVYTRLVAGTTQTGTWTTTIANSGGTIVRTFTGSGLTETVIWDGKNGSGVDQPDGTYTYQLDATAAGGVATSAKGYAIIDRTKQLLVSNLTVSLPFFSPNGDTVQDTTTASGSNAFDDTTFTINIKKPGGTIVRTNVTSGLSFSFTWDGKNGSGVIQADALYTFEVTATNGTASATSTITTTLDNTLPTGSIAAPLNGAVLSNVYTNGVTDVAVTGSTADANFNNWVSDYGAGSNPSTFTGLNSGNSPVTNASFGTWATAPLANGLYTLRLRAWDKAGNVRTVTVQTTVGNFSVSENALQLSAPASNTVTYTSIVPFTLTETLTVKNAGGTVVRTLVNAVSRPAATYNDVWNGKNASSAFLPDGPYFYVATVTDGTHNFTWDLTNQYLNDWATEQNLTMPNWDPFNNQPLVFTYNFAQPSRVTIAMKHGRWRRLYATELLHSPGQVRGVRPSHDRLGRSRWHRRAPIGRELERELLEPDAASPRTPSSCTARSPP